MKKILFNLFVCILLLLALACTDPPPEEIFAEKIFELDGTIYETDLDYPYIYVAAYTDGFWRIDISNDEHTAIELPLLDSTQNITQANYIDAHGNEVIALTENNVWRSISSGMTWYCSEIGIDQVFEPQALSRSPFNPSKLFLVNQGDAMYTSSDRGESWQKGLRAWNMGYYYSYWDPYRKGDIWIEGMNNIGSQFLYCVENYGTIKKAVNIPQYSEIVWLLGIEFDSSSIYLSTGDGEGKHFLKSTDGGYNWNEIATDIPDSLNLSDFYKDPYHPGTFYFFEHPSDIYRSSDTLRTIDKIMTIQLSGEHEFIQHFYCEPVQDKLYLVSSHGIYSISLDEVE